MREMIRHCQVWFSLSAYYIQELVFPLIHVPARALVEGFMHTHRGSNRCEEHKRCLFSSTGYICYRSKPAMPDNTSSGIPQSEYRPGGTPAEYIPESSPSISQARPPQCGTAVARESQTSRRGAGAPQNVAVGTLTFTNTCFLWASWGA